MNPTTVSVSTIQTSSVPSATPVSTDAVVPSGSVSANDLARALLPSLVRLLDSHQETLSAQISVRLGEISISLADLDTRLSTLEKALSTAKRTKPEKHVVAQSTDATAATDIPIPETRREPKTRFPNRILYFKQLYREDDSFRSAARTTFPNALIGLTFAGKKPTEISRLNTEALTIYNYCNEQSTAGSAPAKTFIADFDMRLAADKKAHEEGASAGTVLTYDNSI